MGAAKKRHVERIQTGFRMERRIVSVLKGLAEYHGLSLGDLMEGIVLHAFDGKLPFDDDSRNVIDQLKTIYHMDLSAADSHLMEG